MIFVCRISTVVIGFQLASPHPVFFWFQTLLLIYGCLLLITTTLFAMLSRKSPRLTRMILLMFMVLHCVSLILLDIWFADEHVIGATSSAVITFLYVVIYLLPVATNLCWSALF